MAQIEDVESWVGAEVVDHEGQKLGKLSELYVDRDRNTAAYGAVATGLLGRKHHLVSLVGATFGRDHVRVGFGKDLVDAAPEVGDEGLTAREVGVLDLHYGLDADGPPADPDALRYESASVLRERRDRADADLRHAEELEAEAARRSDRADAELHDARSRQDAAAADQAERDRLLAEAEDARRSAEGA